MSSANKPGGVAEAAFLPDLLPAPMSPIGAEGHRARMRQRLLKAGPEALADHEMLEMILFIALPRRDTKPIARDLLARFRTFGAVLGAPETELRAVHGMGEAGAAAVKLVQAAALRMLRQDVAAQPVFATWDRLTDYLMAALGEARTEQFRVLFLDGRNRLIADELQGLGTIDHASAYPREVVRRCLELHASAVILVHNHPSGEPTPSRDDVTVTGEIVRAAATMGIAVHDYVVVGKGKWVSLRAEKLM